MSHRPFACSPAGFIGTVGPAVHCPVADSTTGWWSTALLPALLLCPWVWWGSDWRCTAQLLALPPGSLLLWGSGWWSTALLPALLLGGYRWSTQFNSPHPYVATGKECQLHPPLDAPSAMGKRSLLTLLPGFLELMQVCNRGLWYSVRFFTLQQWAPQTVHPLMGNQ